MAKGIANIPDKWFWKVSVRSKDGKTWDYKGITPATTARAAALWAKRVYKSLIVGIRPAYTPGRMTVFSYGKDRQAA